VRVELLGQPADGTLRDLLTQELRLGHFQRLSICVAFLKVSGLTPVASAIAEFRTRGGFARLITGIDHGGTSYEGLAESLRVFDRVVIVHDETIGRTFHPKLYCLEGTDRATLVVGSSNVTGGGLATNYELNVVVHLVRSDPEDVALLSNVTTLFDAYDEVTPTTHLLDQEFLAALRDEGYVVSETVLTAATIEASRVRARLFGRGEKLVRERTADNQLPPRESGFWKKLSKFDVSQSSAPGQILIPIRFLPFFPPLQLTQAEDADGGGRKWEATFPVTFVNQQDEAVHLPDARFILYEPKRDHPRQNREPRFTLHNTEAFRQLRAGDVLLFTSAQDGSIGVRQLPPDLAVSLNRGRFGAWPSE
jgi:HKD family nuclease